MESQTRGWVTIVTLNNLHLTKRAIASVLAQDTPVDLLVIDNKSNDGTIGWLRTQRGITVIYLPERQSLASCWNLALQCAWQAGRHEALCVNNDVIIRPDTYRMLLSHGGPFVTCVSVDKEEQLGSPGDRKIEDLRPGRPHPDFSCWLMRKEVTNAIGYFPEDYYPAFYEDNFYHVTMHRAGIRACCIDLPILHLGSSTVKNASSRERARIQRGAAANKERFFKQFGCVPGTPEYEALFDESKFGMNSSVARHVYSPTAPHGSASTS